MKNKLERILTIICLAALIVSSCLWTGCASTPLKDALGNTLTKTDIQTYGETVGEIGYYVFKTYENNEKYAKQIERCKSIYAALENAKVNGGREGLDLAAINDATCEIITMAATAKLGPANGALVGAGARCAILLGYNFYKNRVQEDNLEVYLNAVYTGIERAKKNGADFIPAKTPIDELIAIEPSEECGIECVIYKVEHALQDKNLTDYDRKRLKKRLKELNEQYEKMKADFEKEEGLPNE